jgi:hypothetical protein
MRILHTITFVKRLCQFGIPQQPRFLSVIEFAILCFLQPIDKMFEIGVRRDDLNLLATHLCSSVSDRLRLHVGEM